MGGGGGGGGGGGDKLRAKGANTVGGPGHAPPRENVEIQSL
jgi:hypothetical protein